MTARFSLILEKTRGHRPRLQKTSGRLNVNGGTMKPEDCILFSGAANGAEAAFGAAAERHGIEEVNFTFDGHNDSRRRGVRVLTHEELKQGDVSLTYVSRLMNRTYSDTPLFRKILQTIWHQINNGQESISL